MHDQNPPASPDPSTTERTWNPGASRTIERLGGRPRLDQAIQDLQWVPYPLPFPPLVDLMLQVVIIELDMPATNRIGVTTTLRPAAWLLGIQSPLDGGHTTRKYVLQHEVSFLLIATDTW